MGGRSRPSESSKIAERPLEKKKGLGDWVNFMKPANEEKDHWVIRAFVVVFDVKFLCSWYICGLSSTTAEVVCCYSSLSSCWN